jgi:polyhydroxyalkanoate synthase subunit PhaC
MTVNAAAKLCYSLSSMAKAVRSAASAAGSRVAKAPRASAVARVGASAEISELFVQIRGAAAMALGGQSPWPAFQAWEEWAAHLAASPSRQAELWREATAVGLSFWQSAFAGGSLAEWRFQPLPDDRRFRDPDWRKPPFAMFAQAQLATEAFWRAATSNVPGVPDRYARRVEFLGRLGLNTLAPVNFAATNPRVFEAALRTGGMNFAAGAARWAEDAGRLARGESLRPTGGFRVGETIAITKGEVVFRNELIELIQYAPTTRTVRREPILIVPAWMMKYYILDLSPPHSLVRHLVEHGHSVFMISWKNPGPELRDLHFDDYRRLGPMAALDAIGGIAPGRRVHAAGYCLGGTLLAIAAAAMGRDGDERLASLSLFAAQTDFSDVGDLMLFVDDAQLALLRDAMHLRGFLDTRWLGGAFALMRAEEMVFAHLVARYMLGEDIPPDDMSTWLSDPTRMPERAHGEYLRQLVLDNSFARGRYRAGGATVSPQHVRAPLFVVGAERDHIAPWRSVASLAAFGSTDATFVLAEGDHHTGVICPPGRPDACFRMAAGAAVENPAAWRAEAVRRDGSWWPEWRLWLDERSSPEHVAPPPLGRARAGLKPLGPAPGVYVLER